MLLYQTNRQYLVQWTVSVTQELFTGLRQTWGKEWTRWAFPTLNITLFLFSEFNVIYFLTNRTCVRNGLRDFSITLYVARLFALSRWRILFCTSFSAQVQTPIFHPNRAFPWILIFTFSIRCTVLILIQARVKYHRGQWVCLQAVGSIYLQLARSIYLYRLSVIGPSMNCVTAYDSLTTQLSLLAIAIPEFL
jgi:hypothetical protein